MKKVIYALILPLVVVGGLVFANSKMDTTIPKKPIQKEIPAAEREAAIKYWETTPGGIQYKKWEDSPQGKKVLANEAKIRTQINDFTEIEAVVTSFSLPPGTRLGYAMMARINGVDYIVRFDTEKSQLEQLQSLRLADKIIIKSHAVSHAPKYAYPIINVDYLEKDGKVIFKRAPRKDNC